MKRPHRPRYLAVMGVMALSALLGACNGDDSPAGNDGPSVPPEVTPTPPTAGAPVQVAFMPDIHFHDVYGSFSDGSFQGLPNAKTGQFATIRTMYAQLTSTRLFNENYFAFLAALDDAAARGVKYIALPGDFSDDGQPVHIRGLKKVLDEYANKYGMEFFAAPGNHDPNVPFDRPAGKSDYLGTGGQEQRIYSRGAAECTGYAGQWSTVPTGKGLPTICTEEVKEQGYAPITEALAWHGFMPKENYLYWETPYSHYTSANYSYRLAAEQADWVNRQYEICTEGTGGKYRQDSYTHCLMVPDASYVVEPVEGLWLVAIDANVYAPKASANDKDPANPANFEGSGNAGYNKMLTHKTHVVEWLKDVVQRGEAQGKQVIAFSHFPMTEFYNGASGDIESLFGIGAFQMARRPSEDTTRTLAQTGLKLHIGGHMHFNDTGMRSYDDGQAIFNIQAPSLAAYVPAYKLLTLSDAGQVEVQTMRVSQVPRFDELFEHYREEHKYLADTNSNKIWNESILDSRDYHDFNTRYLSELARLRFLPQEWPCEMRELVFSLDGEQMMILSQLNTQVTLAQLQQSTGNALGLSACMATAGQAPGFAPSGTFAADWGYARDRARALAQANGMSLESFAQWTAFDLATDFYRLANAGDLALYDISPSRAQQYKMLAQALSETQVVVQMDGKELSGQNSVGAVFQGRFKPLLQILLKLATGAPSDHFMIDLQQRTLVDRKTSETRF